MSASLKSAEDLLTRLAAASGPGLKGIIARNRKLLHPGIVENLADLAREKIRVNPHESLRIAEAALAVARAIGGEEALARGLRAKANALWVSNQNREAVELFDQATALYRKSGNQTELGRTLSTSIQALIRIGEYGRALEGAARAREIFRSTGDTLRLARLELNVANIYHRQDRFREAQETYEAAYRKLAPLRDTEAIAVALHNMAVCLIALNDFERALATHHSTRAFCREHGMPALVAQADYNISYLYYLRGEYSRALEGLRAAAVAAREAGDAYHTALCSMDQAEIYLELNMTDEAAEMAQEAYTQFQALGMNYEAAKSLVNVAIAVGQTGSAKRSIQLFARAREIFIREKNHAWPSLIGLYQGLVLFDAGRFAEARPLCEQALEFFRKTRMAGKEILCRLLLARLALRGGDIETARTNCTAALHRLAATEAPHLLYQAEVLMGQIEEAAQHPDCAVEQYRLACSAMESLRDVLRDEELKIAFMKNKLEVYENLVRLCMNGTPQGCGAEEVFALMEQAKSRSLRDLFFQPPRPGPAAESETAAARDMRALREELNWYYHRMDLEQLGQEPPSEGSIERLHEEVRFREKKLLRLLRDQPPSELDRAGVAGSPALTLESIRAVLAPGTVLLEYFRAGDQLLAAVLTNASLTVTPLALAAQVNPIVRLLQLQFSKFRLGPRYVAAVAASSFEAARAHLNELYEILVAPIRPLLRGRHLVLVPHENLHRVPLHAMFDGHSYLIDSFTVSYAPSATIHALCAAKPRFPGGSSLIFGVPDEQAPLIVEEVRAVAEELPQPEVFLGSQATRQVLRDQGPAARFIHIATHGRFRTDNPMFSAIRLGDGYLTLYDLYRLRLPAELITLSGCSTGLNVVAKGDELLGLTRGLLNGGAKSLLLTLWDVQDRTTSELMSVFYHRLASGESKGTALKEAMMDVRQRHPHPYYWAPFVLVGSEG